MQKRRMKYQHGCFTKRQRRSAPPVWEFCYRDPSQPKAKQHMIFSTVEYPTKRDVQNAVQPILLRVNGCEAFRGQQEPRFSDLVEKFITEEHLREIKAQPVGSATVEGLRYSTAVSYLSYLERHILPRWGDSDLSSVGPMEIAQWLQQVNTVPRAEGGELKPLSAKSKGHPEGANASFV